MVLVAGDVTDFLSVNLSTIICTLLNFLILLLIIKHFLFDKINKVLEDRKNDVKITYDEADEAKANALKLQEEYEEKLLNAKEESATIIQSATKKAQQRSDEIIFNAKAEAKGIAQKATADIEREKKIAVNKIKDDITNIAFSVAEVVIEKDLKNDDNEKLIEQFIDNVGEM